MVKEISSGSTSQFPPGAMAGMQDPNNINQNTGGVSVSQISNGASFEGKYMDAKTGETVVVSNTAIDGDKMIFITDKGIISADEFSNYVKVEDDDNQTYTPEPVQDQAPRMYEKGYEEDIANVLKPKHFPKVTTQKPTVTNDVKSKKQDNVVTSKLNKFFEKIESTPQIDIKIIWPDFPYEKFATICEFLDITDEASDYLYNKYFNKEKIKQAINECFISNHMNEDVDEL